MDEAFSLIDGASHLHFFTGAGMSAESGIATYRDAETGVWENVDPTAMASIDAWAVRPDEMWAWYLWCASLVRQAEPNAGHRAIGATANATVTTQNIDDLHERGGSTATNHLHGSLFDFRCSDCGTPWDHEPELLTEPVPALKPPMCKVCAGLIRPGVVWFGEALPAQEWEQAERHMREADVVVIVGTSGVVFPAASLPLIAVENGTPVIEVSPVSSDLTQYADVHIEGTAADVLPRLLS